MNLLEEVAIYRVLLIVKIFVSIIQVIIPLILIYSIIRKIVKSIFANKIDSSIVKESIDKTIAALLVYLLPIIILFFLSLVYDTNDFVRKYEETSFAKVKELESKYATLESEKIIREKIEAQEKIALAEKKRLEQDKTVSEYNKKRVENKKKKEMDSNGNITIGGASVSIDEDTLQIHFIASGYYDDAILIRTKDNVIFMDSGRYNTYKKVIPYLDSFGITNIDLLIGSHLHNDHIAGQAVILDKYNVGNIVYPDDIFTCSSRGTCKEFDQKYIVDALKNHGMVPTIITPPKKITVGNMELYFLGPTEITNSQNHNSFVFILKFGERTMMFTGDTGGSIFKPERLQPMADSLGISLDVDILKHPHHGNTTLTDRILTATSPTYLIVPNFHSPQYPSSANMSKLSKYSKIYRQSDSPSGNIIITIENGEISING